MNEIKVMTYNIHSGIGRDKKYDLDRIIEIIRRENPDFVALQEIDVGLRKSRFDDQPRYISQALGMAHYFCMIRVTEKGEYGILTLSRYPIHKTHKFDLSYRSDIEARGLSLTQVRLPDMTLLNIYNIHLGLGVRERSHQRKIMLSESVLLNNDVEVPKILMGDFNDQIISVVHGKLRRHLNDIFKYLRSRQRATFKWKSIPLKLDHIYASHHFEPLDAYILKTVLTQKASDHFPLVGILALEKENR